MLLTLYTISVGYDRLREDCPSPHGRDMVGRALLRSPFEFAYSVDGVGLWLAVVIVISVLASLVPALRATQVSVREALAYE